MKEIDMKGRKIVTPWLRVEEAAQYCGISRSTFETKACGLPHGGSKRTRIYHCRILDQWMEGAFPEIPFTREQLAPRRQRVRRIAVGASGDDLEPLVDPMSGKVY